MNEWYKDWFNSEDYLIVYKHRNNEEANELINLILKSVELSEGAKVLDLACGAGRHSINFAKKSFEVTAIDLSANLLKEAKKNATSLNLNIDFIQSDIREFSTDKKFDLVVNLFTSFGYFESDEDNFKVFKLAYDSLIKGGYFVFDYFNEHYIKENLVPFDSSNVNGLSISQSRKIEDGRVKKDILIKKGQDIVSFQESVKLYSKETLEKEFTKTGFKICNLWGNIDGSVFNNNSPRLIYILKK